jgi:hypothetical protein
MLSSKKTISVLLALVLVMSFCYVAFGDGSQKIEPPKPSVTVQGSTPSMDMEAIENDRLAAEQAALQAEIEQKATANVQAPVADLYPVDAKANPIQGTPQFDKGDRVDLFFEGFNAGVPPAGWTSIVNNTYTWQESTYNPFEGAANAHCWYDDMYSGTQDEWMISPSIDLTTGGTNWFLNFWWLGSYYWSVDPNDNCDLTIYITTDDGTTWTELWNEHDAGVFTNWTWYEVTIDLTAYLGESDVKFGIQYYGYDGAEFGVDAFAVNDAAPPVGRCCYGDPTAPDCIDDISEADCFDLGGYSWFQGLNCVDNPCPTAPDNDEWTNAEEITTFPTTITGTTEGATIDCPGVLDWEAIWYVFEAPYGENDITVSYCGTSPEIYSVGIVLYEDPVVCENYIIADNNEFITCPGGDTNPVMNWDRMPAGTYYFPVYVSQDKGTQPFTFEMNVTEAAPLPQGASCSDPIPMTIGLGDLPYTIANQTTCGFVNVESETCLGLYDGGEDIFYEVTLSEAMNVRITMDPKGTTYTGFSINDVCAGATCIAYATQSGSAPYFLQTDLPAGTYYVMVDTWPAPDCIPDFDLTFELAPSAEPGDNCTDPIKVELPAELPYLDADQYTCGRVNNYAAADMCYTYGYGGGEDVVYEVTVTAPVTIEMTLDPKGTTWTYIEIRTECVPPAGSCVYYMQNTGGTAYTSGPIELAPGTYYMIVDTWPSPACIPAFDLSITEGVPCVVECPSGSTTEDEPCGSDLNGGCNMATPAFESIALGETVCGTVWFDGSTRDTDWFLFTLDDWYEVTVTAEAEFDALWGFLEYATNPGSGDCADLSGYLEPYLITEPCQDPVPSITVLLPPGDWMVFMAPTFDVALDCADDPTYWIKLEGVLSGPSYCDANTSYCDEYIQQFIFGSQIDNVTGCDFYTDYSDTHVAVVEPGGTYPVTLVVGDAWDADQGALWVDWNQDYVFDPLTEEVFLGSGLGPYNATVTVPEDAVLGTTTMRVRLTYSVTPVPCGTLSYGEVEDYGIEVVVASNTMALDQEYVHVAMAYLVTPMDIHVILGGAIDPTQVDPATVTLNGLAANTSVILPEWPDFDGQVIKLGFPMDDFVLGYGLLWDQHVMTYTVSGQYFDTTPFSQDGDVLYYGHSVGDLNVDGQINITDLTFMVGYLFNGGAAPRVVATADVNASGNVNVADVTYFAAYLFSGGEAPRR